MLSISNVPGRSLTGRSQVNHWQCAYRALHQDNHDSIHFYNIFETDVCFFTFGRPMGIQIVYNVWSGYCKCRYNKTVLQSTQILSCFTSVFTQHLLLYGKFPNLILESRMCNIQSLMLTSLYRYRDRKYLTITKL